MKHVLTMKRNPVKLDIRLYAPASQNSKYMNSFKNKDFVNKTAIHPAKTYRKAF